MLIVTIKAIRESNVCYNALYDLLDNPWEWPYQLEIMESQQTAAWEWWLRHCRLDLAHTLLHLQDPVEVSLTLPEIAATVLSAGFCIWYFLKKHWLANNVLGLAFAVQGIENLSIGSVTTGVILLSGLFIYDIFWVFCTPVMVSHLCDWTRHFSLARRGSVPTA